MNGDEIFADGADRRLFLATLETIQGETPFSLLAYCLMGNHFHFAIKVGQNPLSTVMQRLLTSYSRAFNRRHGRVGHLFQARYKSYLCTTDRYLAALIRYIHENPVRAGLCREAKDWPWSSHALHSQGVQCSLVDVAYVRQIAPGALGAGSEEGFQPWPFDPPMLRVVAERRTLEAIVRVHAGEGASLADLRSSRGSYRRQMVAREAVAEGYKLAEIARLFGCSVVAVHRWLRPKAKLKPDAGG